MTFKKRPKRTMAEKMTIELAVLESDKFTELDLIEVLDQVTFGLINISLTTAKANVGVRGNGFAPIGFVNKFYINEEGKYVFDVAVFNKFAQQVKGLVEAEDEYLAITARVFMNKEDQITKIIGLDVTPVTR